VGERGRGGKEEGKWTREKRIKGESGRKGSDRSEKPKRESYTLGDWAGEEANARLLNGIDTE